MANGARMEEMGDNAVDSAKRLDEIKVTSSLSDDVRSLFFDLRAVDFGLAAVISTDAEGDSSSMTLLLFVPYTRCMLMSASRL